MLPGRAWAKARGGAAGVVPARGPPRRPPPPARATALPGMSAMGHCTLRHATSLVACLCRLTRDVASMAVWSSEYAAAVKSDRRAARRTMTGTRRDRMGRWTCVGRSHDRADERRANMGCKRMSGGRPPTHFEPELGRHVPRGNAHEHRGEEPRGIAGVLHCGSMVGEEQPRGHRHGHGVKDLQDIARHARTLRLRGEGCRGLQHGRNRCTASALAGDI